MRSRSLLPEEVNITGASRQTEEEEERGSWQSKATQQKPRSLQPGLSQHTRLEAPR